MLAAQDVGHRVVVRRFVGIGEHGRPVFTDLLGVLTAIEADRVIVVGDHGDVHAVPLGDIAAAKRIPGRRARYSEIIELERVADRAWPAPVREWLGDWLLRAAAGWTSRANSALPLGDAGRPLDAAISACHTWYTDRGLTPRITVPLPLRRDLVEALTVRRWHAQPVVLVQTAPLAHALTRSPAVTHATELREEPSDDFLAIAAARKTSLPDAARHVLTAVAAVTFAEIRAGSGSLLAIARGAVVDDWLHLGLVEVVGTARRRGLAHQVIHAVAEWGAVQGATRAFIQVEEENKAAVALYRQLGFTTHHRYITFHAA